MKGPIAKSSGNLLERFGISKIASNFITGINDGIQPTINIEPYMLDGMQTDGDQIFIGPGAFGFNGIYVNDTINTMFIREACLVMPGALLAGELITGYMVNLSHNTSPFPMVTQLTPALTATVVGSFYLSSVRFDQPYPLQPQDVLGIWVSNVTTAALITMQARVRFQL